MARPDLTLPQGWRTSEDRAVSVVGDGAGLHVLMADSSKAYAWRTVATLAEPGFDTDQWIGNSCVTGSGKAAVVVYAPREFTNTPELLQRGGFAAVVNLQTGAVTKLVDQVSLAYFDPGCGLGETAVLSQEGDQESRTRLLLVDATTGKVLRRTEVKGQFTSAVPVRSAIVGARGGEVVQLDAAGKELTLARTTGAAFAIHPDAEGGLAFLDTAGKTSQVHSLAAGRDRVVAGGSAGTMNLTAGTAGRVFLEQRGKGPKGLPAAISHVDADPGAGLSTQGALVIDQAVSSGLRTHVANPLAAVPTGRAASIAISARATGSGAVLRFTVDPTAGGAVPGGVQVPSPSLTRSSANTGSGLRRQPSGAGLIARPLATNWATSTIDDKRGCAVPRNDPAQQAMQPTPNQVEWAADMAIRGSLTSTWVTQGGWRATDGLGTVNPQGMFPLPALTGGGRIPAQVLLGILAQESNLWQASSHSLPGQTGNPLIGNFYGTGTYDAGNPAAYWVIDWTKVDCGYGIGQQTDGMHSPDFLRTGDQVWPAAQQKAVALDYTSNIAVAAQTLASKWNELHSAALPAPITMNNDSASSIENWFAAAWDYNSGFNPYSATGPWGLGWGNNPANPIYDPNRLPFLDNNHYADAAHPQNWPYEEKVMGWAAWPLNTGRSFDDSGNPNSGNTAGYSASWWNNNAYRTAIKPPLSAFCNAANNCNAAAPPHCTDLACFKTLWYTQPVTWRPCATGVCGNEYLTYKTLRAEPGNGKAAPPDCAQTLPSGAWVIDSVNGAVPSMSGSCSKWWTDRGTLGFDFSADANSEFEGKEDLHQVGGGFDGHFWFTHTRQDNLEGQNMAVTASWTFDTSYWGTMDVYAHVPDTGAQTPSAHYVLDTAMGQQDVIVSQAGGTNRWVKLGRFTFNSKPAVHLSNFTSDGTGSDDIAFDGMAVVPIQPFVTPMITLPAANPNAPDIDYTQQTPVPIEGPGSNAKTLSVPSAKGGRTCGPVSKARTQLCTRITSPTTHPKALTAPSPSTRRSAQGTGLYVSGCDANTMEMITRTQACFYKSLEVDLVDPQTQAVLGVATFDVEQSITLYPGQTGFNDYMILTPTRIDPALIGVTLPNLSVVCSGACTTTGVYPTGVWAWTVGDMHQVSYSAAHAWSNTTGSDKLNLSWSTDVAAMLPSTPRGPLAWQTPPMGEVRCDNNINGLNASCVFDKFIPTLTINTAKNPVASAYYYVLEKQLATHPGSEAANSPLHRLMDDATRKKNRGVICPDSWTPNPVATTPSCDEYPFASSRESGAMLGVTSGNQCAQFYAYQTAPSTGWTLTLDPRYPLPSWNELCGRGSIPADQNSGAGTDLSVFINAVRLNDDDAYYLDESGMAACASLVCTVIP